MFSISKVKMANDRFIAKAFELQQGSISGVVSRFTQQYTILHNNNNIIKINKKYRKKIIK